MASTSRSSRRTRPAPQRALRDPLSPPQRTQQISYFEERALRRKEIQDKQDKSLIHGFELQRHASKILASSDFSSLQTHIEGFMKMQDPGYKTLFDSFVFHYPNALSLKLAKLLQLHPPLKIRTEIINFLHEVFTREAKMCAAILIELKTPLLHSIKMESEEDEILALCEVIGFASAKLSKYPLGGWVELCEYVCICFNNSTEWNQLKGLKLIAELAVEVDENRDFWSDDRGNFTELVENVLKLVDLPDEQFQSLVFDASLTIMGMSRDLERTEICNSLMPVILRFIDRRADHEDVVVGKVRLLNDLVTMDKGKIFDGKEGDVFWCMIRLTETNGASEVLKIAAVAVLKELDKLNMDSMQRFIQSLSPEEVKRVFAVSVDMISCIVENPIWYHVDIKNCKEVGMTETYARGMFLLNWLVFEGDKSVVVPMLIEMLQMKYVSHGNWRVRYAAMVSIGTIASGNFQGDMIQYFGHVATLLLNSRVEPNHRVIWATIDALKCLSGYKELLMQGEYHVKFLNKLIYIITCGLCSRVQEYAIITTRFLVQNCCLEKIPSVVDDIVAVLLICIKHETQKVQEEAIETLTSIAVFMPINFCQSYYYSAMKTLKETLSTDYSPPKLFIRAKCLECMGYLVRKNEDKFTDRDVDNVITSMVKLDIELSKNDYSTRIVILKALDLFCQCPKVNVDRFIDKVMPMLLTSAQLDTDLRADEPMGTSLTGDKTWIETLRVRVCNILSFFAHRPHRSFTRYIGKVNKIFLNWLDCSSLETRNASASAIPNILHSIKVGVQNEYTRKSWTGLTIETLVDALRKETDSNMSTRLLRLLPKCIQTSGSLFNNRNQINIIADEIKDVVKKILVIEIQRVCQEAGLPEGGSESLPSEQIIQDGNYLILTTIATYKAQYVPHVDDLLTNVALFLALDIPDRPVAVALSIFNIIMSRFPYKLKKYQNQYSCTACHLLRENYPRGQLDAARAIGICAKFGGKKFKTMAAVGISRLYDLMIKRMRTRGEESKELTKLCDTAVAALGKICEFHRDSIDYPKVVKNWLDYLPLKGDFHEAKYAHGLLSEMLGSKDKHLFGSDNENLPQIISVVKEILSQPNRMATEEAINQMINFINKHGGME